MTLRVVIADASLLVREGIARLVDEARRSGTVVVARLPLGAREAEA